MNKIKLFLVTLYSLFFALSANGIEVKNCPILNSKEKIETQREFVQKRYIKGLSRPIISTGKLVIETNEGSKSVKWINETPYPNTVIVNKDGFFVEQEGGNTKERYDSAQFKKMAQLVLNLHMPNRGEMLNKQFELKCLKSESGYTLSGIPKSRTTRRYIKSISVEGEDRPRLIRVEDSRGDKNEIELK